MRQVLFLSIIIFSTISLFPQKDTVIIDGIEQGQWVHQYIVREAYKLLKHQLGYDIPLLNEHIGDNQTGNMAFVPGNLVVIGAYREDEEDVVYGYSGIGGIYTTNTHFWDPDCGDGSHFCISPTNECFENAYEKARTFLYSGPIVYNYAEALPNPYWFACGAPGLITGLKFEYDNLFDLYLTGSARILAVRNSAGYLDYCSEPLQVQWSQSFREKIVWEILGRIAHLLADVNTPAHAHYDQHDPVFGGTDTYENTMRQNNYYMNWDYLDGAAQNTLYGGPINVINHPNPLKYLFYTSAQIAGHFPSDDVSGNNNYGLNDPFTNYSPLQTIINQLGSPPSSVNVGQIANTSYVYSIRATAALLYWFSYKIGIIPPPPPISPIISHFTQNPNPLCKGSWGRVNSYLSQGNGILTYTWEPTPSNLQIDPHGSYCNVFIPNTSAIMSPDGETMSLKCTVSNSAGSDWKIHYLTSTTCSGCPTLSFEVDGEMIDENPLLITSLSNLGTDVTDYYVIQNALTPNGNEINLAIHEPQTEHTWLDCAELIETRVKRDELVAVNDEGEIINYKESTAPLTVILNGETNITEILSSMDTLDIELLEGDVLTVVRNTQSPEGDGDGDVVLGGEVPPPAKDKPSFSISLIKEKELSRESIKEDIDDTTLGELFFRPNKSIIAKRLRNLPPGNLEITVNKSLVLNYLALVNNMRTARTRALSLLNAEHNQQGDVKNLLSNIDQSYAEIYPGEIINFTFQQISLPSERTVYIIKTVGRYETDTTAVFNKLTKTTEEIIIPKENKLYDNYPNPFNPTTQIKFAVKEDGLVNIKVYDALGKEVAVLVNETKQAGIYTVSFDASSLSSGIYFYTISTKDFRQSKKMLLIK